ncbi:MAG: ACT domain-containing protein [Paracoccaceae bacterium]
MADIAHTAEDMVSNMAPELRTGDYVFVTTVDPELAASLSPEAMAMFREDEGQSFVVSADLARDRELGADQPMRCITLKVFSALDGVGLTAAVATALGDRGIPCNMIAAYHHDHVFVPCDMAERALQVLKALQKRRPDQD